MIETTFTDPSLPSVALLFDGEAMRDLLTRRLERAGGGEIVACRPTYVRFKPQTSCLVAYEIDICVDGRHSTHRAHIRTFADDRGRRRMTNRKLEKLVARASAADDDPGIAWVTYLPALNGMFSIFPVDYDLRSLLTVATASSARTSLRQVLGNPALELARAPELIRYKPGRKALLRYTLEGDHHPVAYGKTLTDDRTGMLRHATEILLGAGLTTPTVLGTIPALHFILHEEAPGTQLAAMRDDPRYSDLVAAIAEPLALLQRAEVTGLRTHRLADEAGRLHETANLLGVVLPDQRERLQQISRTFASRLAEVEEVLATSHGDFYDDQALVAGDRIAIIDLDEIRIAHPLLDIGNMLGHLGAGEARGVVPPTARPAFTEAMRAHRPMSDRDLALFEAIGVLKLAPGPFRRLEPGWPDAIGSLLDQVESLLAGSAGPRSLDPDIRDPKLPELATLQDPNQMQAHLRDATGDPALALDGIHVQRHKPGRRAILRYDVAGSEPIWGKIFASKRGPRVHEITRAICDARAFGPEVALPDPIAFVPELRLLLQQAVPGEAIEPRLLAGETALADRIADAIHALHASNLDLGRRHDLDAELAPLDRRVGEVGGLFPTLGKDAVELHARIRDRATTMRSWRFRPVHRDFYHQQVLATGDRLSVLDLDDAKMSEPAVDIANFAAHLDLLALQQPARRAEIGRVRDRFVARSRALDPALDDRLIAFLTASTLVRLAGIHAHRKDGERVAAGLLTGARHALETSAAGFNP
jgi:aminoglycoside phosphotransferase (APT) family kinase protein